MFTGPPHIVAFIDSGADTTIPRNSQGIAIMCPVEQVAITLRDLGEDVYVEQVMECWNKSLIANEELFRCSYIQL
jgi:hypothetical protein